MCQRHISNRHTAGSETESHLFLFEIDDKRHIRQYDFHFYCVRQALCSILYVILCQERSYETKQFPICVQCDGISSSSNNNIHYFNSNNNTRFLSLDMMLLTRNYTFRLTKKTSETLFTTKTVIANKSLAKRALAHPYGKRMIHFNLNVAVAVFFLRRLPDRLFASDYFFDANK